MVPEICSITVAAYKRSIVRPPICYLNDEMAIVPNAYCFYHSDIIQKYF